jgi:Secretion system C-terminal sorting domain/FG-GAP-like repeat
VKIIKINKSKNIMKKNILSIALSLFVFNILTAQLCFTDPINSLSKGSRANINGVVTADFNGDGLVDIIEINQLGYDISLLKGNGLGGFSEPTLIYDFVSLRPAGIIKADFNKDGTMDLAVNFSNMKQISILLGNRSGKFSAPVNFTLNNYSSNPSIISDDFNNDGNIDILVSIGVIDPQSLSVMLGNGKGGFLKNIPITTEGMGYNSKFIVSNDFNGDNKKDIAIATSGKVFISLGNGLGDFTLFKSFDSGFVNVGQIISEDFNDDKKYDIAVRIADGILIFTNDGYGSFSINKVLSSSAGISSITSVDLNGDGKKDIAMSISTNQGKIGVRYNTGMGNFSDQLYFDANTISDGKISNFIFCDDFNNDGRIDLATDNYHSYSIPNSIKVLLGNIPISFFTNDVTCYGGNDGMAIANVTCINPISYSWNTKPIQNTKTATRLAAGVYSVTVTDASNTKKTEWVTITEPNPITADFTITPTTICSSPCNGIATIKASGGTPPYTFKWDTNAKNQSSETATGLCAGKYTVRITDSKGCVTDKEVVIKESSSFSSEVYLSNIAAIDQLSVSPAFTDYYAYNLPAKITPNPTNLRNFVDPGKKARFKVECVNKKANGKSIVSGICEVRSNSPYITITDASSALNNIGWNNKAWSADEFEIDIKPNTPPGTIAYIDFIVKENGIEYVTSCIPLPITPLNYSLTNEFTIDDDNNPDSKGNDNDKCEPNEIIEFYPWLDNVSALDAEYVRGRFENLDNLSYINIWNNKSGVNTTVFDTTWWNFSFGKPSIINSNSLSTTPEYDFVFNYNNTSTVNNFKLYLVMAGGFKLFPGNALSLVQWTLPYTFNNEALTVNDFLQNKNLKIYPNPTATLLNIQVSHNQIIDKIIITDLTGKQVFQQNHNTTQVNVQKLAKGMYLLQAFSGNKKFTSKFVKE